MMNFTDVLTRSHRALVILPESVLDSESISTIFRYLLRKFSPEGMEVLIRNDHLFSMASTPPLKTLTYSNEDINAWFVPRKNLLQRIEAHPYDVALDLNVGLSLTSAFLCKASKAPLRISFAKRKGDQFYNFQVKTKGDNGTPRTYRSLIKCLDMF
jgi:hypothetical protein